MIKHNKKILYWEGGKFYKQLILDKGSNCGFIRTIPPYRNYNKFAMNSQNGQSNDEWRDIEAPKSYKENQTDEDIEPRTLFNFDKSRHKMEELQHIQKDDKIQKELWHWNLKLNHLAFPRIKFMALQGKLPKSLNSTEVLFGPTYAYSKATRKPRRNKNGNSKLKETTKPGQCVSVDTFESLAAGFVAKINGSRTNKRYRMTYHLCSLKKTIQVLSKSE